MTEISVNVFLALSKRGCTKKNYKQRSSARIFPLSILWLQNHFIHVPLAFYSTCTANAHVFWFETLVKSTNWIKISLDIVATCSADPPKAVFINWKAPSSSLVLLSFSSMQKQDNYNEISFRNNLTSKRTQGHSTFFGPKMHAWRCWEVSAAVQTGPRLFAPTFLLQRTLGTGSIRLELANYVKIISLEPKQKITFCYVLSDLY